MRSNLSSSGLVVALVVALVVGGTLPTAVVDGKSASMPDVQGDRGDVVYITVSSNQKSTVNIGGPNAGFWIQIPNFKGKTTIGLNTYETGNESKSDLIVAGPTSKINVKTWSQVGPIQPDNYRMNVTADGTPLDVGQLTIRKRTTRGAETFVMPSAVEMGDVDSVADLRKNIVRPNDHSIARGDRFVLALNASGITGFIDSFGDTEGVSLTFRETNNERNTTPNEFSADDISSKRTFVDEENDVTYFVLDTTGRGIEPGDRYDVTFALDGSNPLMEENERESATTTFEVVKRRASIDHVGASVVVEKGETTLTGTTTLAPGSTMKLSAYKYGSNNFVLGPKEVTVGANHTFGTTFDFGDVRRGTGFTFKLIGPNGSVEKSVPGVVAPQQRRTTTTTTTTTATSTTVTTTNVTASTTGNATTATNATATPTATPVSTAPPITAGTVSEGGLPGFEAGTALVALVAAAVLLVRRSS